jgi:hypothetical protein
MPGTKAAVRSYKHAAFQDRNSIRLLTLQPGRFGDSISIILKEVSLDHLPVYKESSYAWEFQNPDCPVICYDADLLITQNCFCCASKTSTLMEEPTTLDRLNLHRSNMHRRTRAASSANGECIFESETSLDLA